ncbi:MAG: DNA polymerase ligase N-terminal domain-containing protein [Planctomycetota bacterium]
MPQAFVIHEHHRGRSVHYDLMLGPPARDAEAPLATWRLEQDPADQPPGLSQPARRIADHGRHFLSYEGPLRAGRGEVRMHDSGTCTTRSSTAGLWLIDLHGRRIEGAFELRRVADDRWRLTRLHPAASPE